MDFKSSGVLTDLRVTFSRDIVTEEDPTSTKASPTEAEHIKHEYFTASGAPQSRKSTSDTTARYVQDQMRQDSSTIVRLLTENEALVYFCGDAKNMAADVTAAFEEILQTERGL